MKSKLIKFTKGIWAVSIIAVTIGIFFLIGTYQKFYDIGFWQDFTSNTFATVFGIAIGVPVGLWFDTVKNNQTEKEKKQKILDVLQKELSTNFQVLCNWKDGDNKKFNARLLSSKIRNESWNAFSDGGELEWIKDPILLGLLSDAYFSINATLNLSNKYFELQFLDFEQNSGFFMKYVYKELKEKCQICIDAIDIVLKEIS